MTEAPDCSLACEWREAANHEARAQGTAVELLVLHYTGMKGEEEALDWLCREESRVSCHYFVFSDGRIVQSVRESRRAWHAGASCWRGLGDINSRSIGIEIANPGHDWGYRPFPPVQMEAVAALCRDIVARHAIAPRDVVAHSDIAPVRKRDPGELFEWRRLHDAGVGLWVEPEPAGDPIALDAAETALLHEGLARFGYEIAPEGNDEAHATFVVSAFQRRFRPQRVDGIADASTLATLRRLLALYESTHLA